MTVSEIIRSYLEEHGYDGLCNSKYECGCGVEDFTPCGNCDITVCEVAYVNDCTTCSKKSECRHDFDIFYSPEICYQPREGGDK
ncbi:MAG: hypothetical protein FWB96_01395 [Defluviitaleaceae bacterium]|nr:hypothetical protein [Defluviitaleaceae bacterium]MCL2261652.1 hypothetical protein [Defluviitaleaceae bacterium]